MPAPDPFAIDSADERSVWYSYRIGPNRWFPWDSKVGSNEKRNRDARAKAIGMNIRRDNWLCHWCRSEIGLHKRADAVFCRERCRKANARARRRFWADCGHSPMG